MQDMATSTTALAGGEPPDGSIARLRTMVKPQLGHVASRLLSRLSALVEIVIVSLVSFILLRSSG
jgi:hypothetical protein